MLITIFGISAATTLSASAAGSSMSNATSISFGQSYSDSITDSSTQDFYKFTMSSLGKINIKLTAYIYCKNYHIYDSNGKDVWHLTSKYWNDVSKKYDMNESIDLSSGTYYFAVKQNSGTGNYNFIISTNGGTVVNSYKLSYNSNGGSGAPATQTGNTSYIISSVEPVRSGYNFLGWSENRSATAASFTAGDKVTLNGDATLYAVWEKQQVYTPPSDNSGFSILGFLVMILEVFVDIFLAIFSIFA